MTTFFFRDGGCERVISGFPTFLTTGAMDRSRLRFAFSSAAIKSIAAFSERCFARRYFSRAFSLSRTYAAGISSATARHRSSLLSIWVSICTVDIVGS